LIIGSRFESDQHNVADADFVRRPGALRVDGEVAGGTADGHTILAHGLEVGAEQEMDFLSGATEHGAVVAPHGPATDNGDFHHSKSSSFPFPPPRSRFDYENDDEEDFETKKSALKIPERPRDKLSELLAAEDGVFRGFGDAELHDSLGRDRNGFAGLGVAAHAGGAVLQHELADARQREGVLRVLVGEGGDVFEDFHRLLFGDLSLLSNCGGELGFRECVCHIGVLDGCCFAVFLFWLKSHLTWVELKKFARVVQAKKHKK